MADIYMNQSALLVSQKKKNNLYTDSEVTCMGLKLTRMCLKLTSKLTMNLTAVGEKFHV